jgi:polyphosphate kinase 2 (PPK2 family)
LESDIGLASLSNGQRRKRRKQSVNYKEDLDSGVLSKNRKAKRHHRRVENTKENTSMVSTRNGKDTSSKGGTIKEAQKRLLSRNVPLSKMKLGTGLHFLARRSLIS